MSELYKEYRPKSFKTIVGQEGAVAALRRMVERERIPHAMLLTGPSGVGKTTIARIIAQYVDCGDDDLIEMNCADFRGVDMVREIRRLMQLVPMHGESRVWIIDEAHKLTNDAQNAFLKLLEDTPEHVYFMLCTTDARRLQKTIHTRCTEIKLTGMSPGQLEKLLLRVIGKEQMKVGEDVVHEIIDASGASARKALVILEQVGYLEKEAAQLEAVKASSLDKDQAFELARTLLNSRRDKQWSDAVKLLKNLEDEDPEGIRYMILAYCRTVLLGGGKMAPRAHMIIDIFEDTFWNSKNAGLAAACYNVMVLSKR